MNATRRPGTKAEDAFLFDLFQTTQGTTAAGLDPALADVLPHQQFASQRLGDRAAHLGGCFNVVECGGTRFGRLLEADEAAVTHVVDLALDPAWRRRRIAGAVLRGAMARRAAAAGPTSS